MNVPQILLDLGFGVRQLPIEAFEIACRHSNFKYFFTDEKLDEGFTFPYERNGRLERIIILRNTIFPLAKLEAAWHEFGHAYYEHYGIRLFVHGSEDKYERQVIDLSLCCMIPTLWVRTKTREELLDEGFTNAQINRRYEIYRAHDQNL